MIIECHGDIFTTRCAFIAIPVNTIGTMGKGLALAAKFKWPQLNMDYQRWCTEMRRFGGDIMIYTRALPAGESRPLLVATKEDWRQPSKIDWVERGLCNIDFTMAATFPDNSCALPMLGAGLGKLPNHIVDSAIRRVLGKSHATYEIWKEAIGTRSQTSGKPLYYGEGLNLEESL